MLLAGLHFAELTCPSGALADPTRPPPAAGPSAPGGDIIDLKNGGILRGAIIDAIPNGHARIQLATGEIATVPWQDIARIERSAPTASGAASASGEGAPVWVHISGSDGAELQRDLNGDHRQWVTVCTAPCDKAVSPQFEYRITGDGIRNSRVFSLAARGGERESLTVDEASRSGFVLGIVGVSVGSLVMVIGLVVVLANATASLVDSTDGVSMTSDRHGEAVGWGVSAVGLAGLIGGVVLIATNARTGVTQSGTAAQAAPAPSDSWVRVPAFQDARRAATPVGALAPPMAIPIFGGRF